MSAPKITINGYTRSAREWAEMSDVSQSTIQKRHQRGIRGKDLIAPRGGKGGARKGVRRKQMLSEQEWLERIMAHDKVKTGMEFGIVELARSLKVSTASIKPAFQKLRNKELFTERQVAMNGGSYTLFRIRTNASHLLQPNPDMPWRRHTNEELGIELEPRLGMPL